MQELWGMVLVVEGFLIDAWIGMLFYRVCRRYKITERLDKIALMRELVRRKKAKYIRDVEPLLDGKNILKIGFKPKGKPCDEL